MSKNVEAGIIVPSKQTQYASEVVIGAKKECIHGCVDRQEILCGLQAIERAYGN